MTNINYSQNTFTLNNMFSACQKNCKKLWDIIRWKYLPIIQPYRQKLYVSKIRKRDHVNVVFLPMTVSMWKYQNLYELLKKDIRFRVYVFLNPAKNFTKEQRIEDLKAMRTFFKDNGVEYIDYELEKGKSIVDIRSVVDPDIIFFTQPYTTVVEPGRRYSDFLDKLVCYSPYSFIPRNQSMIFNSNFEILAWKLYFQTVFNKKTAEKLCRNHGRNVVISGYPGADGYREPADKDVWKVKDRSKKRIIWAPHFSIVKGIGFYKSSFFLEMADYMRTIALEYVDSITIAFKPHPRLFSELCKHPNWGEKKAEEYYNFWESSENTQIETGDFVDLFKGSDAMIHDSGSFVVDYLYFNKPVMFDNPNIEDVKTTADELGVKAYDAHYRAEGLSDIKKFIDEVVIGGKDPMKETRTQFLNDFLRSSDGRTASQIIYDDLVESLWGTNNK